ncbi:hypothetical protein AKJ16_DCAP19919 [Drosera capensis]
MGLSNLRSEALEKSDSKFEKKLGFYARVRETIASLNAKKIISKKTISKSKSARRRDRRLKRLKPYDLSALSDVLPELTEPQEPAPAKFNLNSKSRQKLVLMEGKQLMTVLNHPAFQSDPLAAIHQHLQQTQPIEDKKPVPKKTGGAKKKKKKKSKSTAGSRPMDL